MIEGYRCRRCGQFKKGHMCPGLEPGNKNGNPQTVVDAFGETGTDPLNPLNMPPLGSIAAGGDASEIIAIVIIALVNIVSCLGRVDLYVALKNTIGVPWKKTIGASPTSLQI